MGQQVYRSWEKTKGANIGEMYHSEICRSCAIDEIKKGREIQFDGWLSKELDQEDQCEICDGSFETKEETWEQLKES